MYSRDRLIKAIDNSACLTRRQIDDYLQNKLFPEELYVVEMHLNECPFCNDAVEGYTKSGNANQLLSTVEEFSFTAIPIKEAQPEPIAPVPKAPEVKAPEKKMAPSAPAPAKAKEVKKVPPAEPVKKVTFENEPKRSRKLVPIGIAAALALGLGIWGISKMGGDKDRDNLLAGNGNVAANEQAEDGMFNESSINREEDAAMNAKYGFQNQQPLNGGHYTTRNPGYTADGQVSDSASMAMMADAATEQSSPAIARAEERSGNFVGPVMPREEEQRRTASAPASADKSKVSPMASAAKVKAEPAKADNKTIAANNKDARNRTTATAPNARTTAAKETAKPAENKTPVTGQALTQADKDYKKGLELYNKKQYSASIMYFQSAAKVKDYPNRKKAESYIKLAKSEVVNAERKRNSEKNDK
ncbi:MAG: hypothetical protein EOP54_13580 [Sphingobacteriales bacterium]|nr:MAG: hypothetical protein EOP54_13580 [Sphingobacteriales bacterium]